MTTPAEVNREVRILKTFSELEEMRAVWEGWPGNADSDPDMFFSYLASSPEVEHPYVIVVYKDGTPEVMLVGRRERVRLDFRVGYVHFRPKATILYFVYGGPRGSVSDKNSKLLVDEIQRSLSQDGADAAYLNFIRVDSDLYGAAHSVPGVLSRDYAPTFQSHFVARLGNTAEDFYRTLSPKVRKNQRWQSNRIEKSFPEGVSIRCFRHVSEVQALVSDVENVAKRSYQRGLGVGFADSDAMRLALIAKAEKGGLRGHVLYLAGKAAAFWIGNINGTTFGSDFLGYDEQFAKYSPGMYLILKVIEGFYAEGKVAEVDFATGNAQYKAVLGNCTWEEASTYIFAPSSKGLWLSLLRWATGSADKAAKGLLSRTGLLQRIKKSWRARARIKAENASTVSQPASQELLSGVE